MVLIALLVAGFGLIVLGNKKPSPQPIENPDAVSKSVAIDTPFILTLSAPARKITLESIGQTYSFDPSTQTISGTVPVEKGHPAIFIDIEWADQKPSPRFAKLVLEPAGLPTMTKVFDSTGDLSDVWEMHLHE